ncbi:MAG: uracil-DNA glycosylase [Myxococcota bacterium]
MAEEIREELIEIIRALRIHLIYQRGLGAFVYGLDTMEELIKENANRERFEKAAGVASALNSSKNKIRYSTSSLFEERDKISEHSEPLEQNSMRVLRDTEEKKRLLNQLMDEIGADCKRCKLSNLGRSKVVFGEGNVDARIMFVGEGPGEDEDIQGIPFVGRAGQLLTRIINAMGLGRGDVYIANVVKCRPPENRAPLSEEMDICGQFLKRQIEIITPEVIIALGGTAASYLLGDYKIKISQVRSRELWYRDGNLEIPLVATFHPSYVLRRGESPEVKREVWKDIKIALNLIGMEVKR